jgi:hypothetical protein
LEWKKGRLGYSGKRDVEGVIRRVLGVGVKEGAARVQWEEGCGGCDSGSARGWSGRRGGSDRGLFDVVRGRRTLVS